MLTALSALSLRWGRTIFRVLAAPWVVGTLRQRLEERETHVKELVSDISYARSERDYYKLLYEQTKSLPTTPPSPPTLPAPKKPSPS